MPVCAESDTGTLVTVEVRASGSDVDHAIKRAFSWFREIESRCSRFDEVRELHLAARELAPFRDFAIDAGGDWYPAAANALGSPWPVRFPYPPIHGDPIAALPDSKSRRLHRSRLRAASAHRRLATAGGERYLMAPQTVLVDAPATAAFVRGTEAGMEQIGTRRFRHAA